MSESTITNPDTEYQALRVIDDLQGEHRQAGTVPSQRDFARALNMSVGMTNAIIKRLVGKGWLVMHRINGRNLSYALTPEGTREVAKRSYRYLRRTIGNVVRWKDAIDHAVMEARESGCERVLLVGDSDLDFIVEHAASRHGMVFVRSVASEPGQRAADRQKTMLLYSEKLTEAAEDDALLLQDIIMKKNSDTGETV
jgi:DNA-binding MarR family transcriptional regulator